MKRVLLAVLLVVGMASSAMAGQVRVGSTYGLYQTGSGGEFTLIDVSGFSPLAYGSTTSSSASFQTFCIEATGGEYINTNTLYDAVLNPNAIYGGTVPPTSDPVSAGTGWLYSQFAQGTLANYNFTGSVADRDASAAALQNTIWWLEDEAGDPGATNVFRNAVLAHFSDNAALAKAGTSTTYGVYAINLWVPGHINEYDFRAQDQLFYAPDGGATLMLLGGALMGLGALRRKFRI
jgi:VPDSG-CTERM motif